MKNTLMTFLAVSASFLSTPHSAKAHHGWAEFDSTEVTFQGTVTDFHFVNPHCVVEFEVKDEKGQIRKWQGEFSNPGQLRRKGWTAASLEVGDKLTLTGHLAKNGSPAMHVLKIRTPKGQELNVDYGR
jgi:hypothetical protein